jgi:hypothetical protein
VLLSSFAMSPTKIRSAGVTAAATLAMMGSAALILLWGSLFLDLLNLPADSAGRRVYHTHLGLFLLIALVPPLLAALGFRTGIGLFQLRPWARRAALLWASIALLFCLAMIALRPYETFAIPEHLVSEAESVKQLLAVSLIFMLLPISIWWLFFFRLARVVCQFESPGDHPSTSSLD